MSPALRVAILGAGRTGCSIHRGLSDAGQPPAMLWTRSETTAQAARQEGFPVASGPLPVIDADLIVLAVTDGSVAQLAATLSTNAIVAHTAGALDLSPLRSMQLRGSFHPVVSIASRRTKLKGNSVAIDSSSPDADAALSRLAELLEMHVIRPKGDRALYHAACSLAGNFPQVLLESAIRLGAGCGLSRDESRLAFGPLLVSAARNAAERGPSEGLTGPVRRGDVEIVRRHLQAIAAADGDVEALYRAATRLAIDLAETVGAPNFVEMRHIIEE